LKYIYDCIILVPHEQMTSECPICQDEINETTGSTRLACSHSYHLNCIVKWISKVNTCPCCRKTLGEYETIQECQSNLYIGYTNEVYDIPDIYGEDSTENDNTSSPIERLQWFTGIPDILLPPQIIRIQLNEDNLGINVSEGT